MSSRICRGMKKVLMAGALAGLVAAAMAAPYQVGVYYFPGWRDNTPGSPSMHPWEPIKPYPARKPLLGWYHEGDDAVMSKQLGWMSSYGINYVVFDWYMGPPNDTVYLDHALQAYLRAPERAEVKFSLLWANHGNFPTSLTDWDGMIRYWRDHYFPRAEFLKMDGHPVVFVFSADMLESQAKTFGQTAKSLLARAQTLAMEKGGASINFVAGSGASAPFLSGGAKAAGYSAFSTYNYQQGPGDTHASHSYAELDQGYRAQWQGFANYSNLPLIVPTTSGWDKRPWGGTKGDAQHDLSESAPAQFKQHLQAAKDWLDAHPGLSANKSLVICCWNEFGEGSFIEPTEQGGFQYLEQVKAVFGGR
ncbi:glycoside hydrolase family 99-like domain-containing protein [Chromobacterium sp. IIBBL 290-4]|uniref:glycoside hydrolase family 99-like domain-containing protein n=1 Tax=Chromobacterium sp. IIBBL 290-4 TaxID=2953890 RepID=UPI0020B6448C|nr:glycoside hydrolase family 99-like domain-containing protein [Chromobacterium sp. IIBBL 290-4]UTH74021.1 glycoside hydrolase family 99-like domain-containing protein [Chromobacterium sp. IIBBL 290-4]